MIKRILLDLDDVLNQFTMWALYLHGCDVDPMNNGVYPADLGYDIVAGINLLHPHKKDWTDAEFWGTLPRRAWSEAPKSAEFDWIISTCVSLVGEDQVFLCTAATRDPECLAGKLEWIQRVLPSFLHRQYAITSKKFLLANPETLLIDDSLKNVVDFAGHGGSSVLVPKPWNPNSDLDTLEFLDGILRIPGQFSSKSDYSL